MNGATLAPAAVITVSTTLDDLTDNGNCTLREAVQAANTDTAVDACPAGNGADTIVLRFSSYTLSLAGADENNNATGDLDISSSLSIIGHSPLGFRNIRGGGIDRVLHILTDTITVTLSGVGVLDGSVVGQGGGIYVSDNANLNISESQISDNSATVSGGGMYISANSQVMFYDSSMVDNTVVGGFGSNGGAIDNRGDLQIQLGRIVRNTAGGAGGGIYSEQYSTLNILDSAIHENVASYSVTLGGGGLFINSNATANIANSTIFDNSAKTNGGGILNNGTLNLTNNTISANYADADMNGSGDGGGVGLFQTGSITLKNNIIAGNFDHSSGSEKPDIDGSLISVGYNLIGNLGTETFVPVVGDLVGTSGSPIYPLLGSPGGSPNNLRLLVGSPAINRVPPANCTFISTGTNPLFSNGAPVSSDIRAVSRPQGANCDVGNYEAAAEPRLSKDVDINGPTAGQAINYTISVSNDGVLTLTNGVVSDTLPAGLVVAGPVTLDPPSAGTVGSFPEIVSGLTVAPNSPITITIPAEVQGTVSAGTWLTNTAELTATNIITPLEAAAVLVVSACQAQIDGSPTIYATVQAAVSAANPGDLIKIAGYCAGTEPAPGDVQLAYLDKDLTLQGGHPMEFGGAPDPAVYPTTLDAARGGRVLWIPSLVTVTVEDLTIQGGEVSNPAGGIYIQPDSIVTLNRVSLRDNQSSSGGGLYNRGFLTILESTLEDNRASSGGAIYNTGLITISTSTVRDNSATNAGGGLLIGSNTRGLLQNVTFEENHAGQSGGAIYNSGTSSLTIANCQITDNVSDRSGGAIANQGELEVRNSLIAANTAGQGDTGYGGAFANTADIFGLLEITVISSTIVDNASGRHGGGIYMPNGGDITITQSTFSRNQAGEDGGGIYLANDMVFGLYGRLTMVNSTLSLNQASEDGGGIWAVSQDLSIFISLTHVTLAGNQSTDGVGEGIYSAYGDTSVSFENTLLAGNTAGGPGIDSDCAGTGIYTSNGYNLVGGGGGCPTTASDLTVHGDIFGQVVSTELLDNGGPTLTHALYADSPAVDFVPLISCLPTDQRGVTRPVGSGCDIGAYEFARQLYLPAIRKGNP